MAGPWEQFTPTAETPPTEEAGPWQNYKPQPAQAASWVGDTAHELATSGAMVQTLDAFGQGFKDEWGAAKFGPELKDYMTKAGMFYDPAKDNFQPGKAFNSTFVLPAINALDIALRTVGGTFAGVHEAGKTVLGGTPAALMEAFPLFGAELGKLGVTPRPPGKVTVTGGIGDIPDLRVAKDLGVVGPEKVPLSEGTPTEAAKNAIQPITAYHGSPYSFDAFSFSADKLLTGEGANVYGSGGYFAEHPAVAENYQQSARTMPPLSPIIGESEKIEVPPGNHYQVRIHADPEMMLDLDKTYSEQSSGVRKILDKFGVSDESGTGFDILKGLQKSLGFQEASNALSEAGVVGNKYLDQVSRDATKVAQDQETAARVRATIDKLVPGSVARITAEKNLAAWEEAAKQPTRNFVIFNDKDVEITHRNGEPVQRAMPAEQPTDLVKRSDRIPAVATDKAGNIRLDLIETSKDAENIIRAAAEENDGFMEARTGDIAPSHLGALSEVLGIPVEQLDAVGMGRTLRNDSMVRWATQALIQSSEDTAAKMRQAAMTNKLEDLQAFQEARMRHNVLQEHVAGLTAEWGRTGNVFQEFRESVKSAQDLGRFLKDKKGESIDDLRDIVREGSKMDPRTELPRFMAEMRKPTFLDKAIWYWTNAVLSGPVTHSKFGFANAAYVAYDTLVATPIAGFSGTIRSALGKEDFDRVYMGETFAKLYGTIAGVPDAIYAAGRAVRSGMPTPVPGAQPKGAGRFSPITGLQPVGGVVGNVIGTPSRVISGIHSFFNFLGYRAEIEAQAFKKAMKAGLNPDHKEFWQVQADHAKYPDDPAMDAAIAAGQRANFVQDLGPSGKALQGLLAKVPIGRFIMPFIKVPGNIFNAMQEGTPLAFLDSRMRDDLLGKNGGAAKDQATGRLIGGSAIMGTAAYWTLNGTITGNGPIEPTQRAEWLLTNQPNSYKTQDGMWKSYDRFGPIAGWLGLAANATDGSREIAAALQEGRITQTQAKKADKDLLEGVSRIVVGFSRSITEAGFQGLFNMVEEMTDPSKTRASGVGRTAASALPFSSFQSQTASFMDPYVRDAQTFLDGIRNAIPVAREALPYARDWSGAPRPNPMYHSMVRNQPVNVDPVDLEMQRLDLKPGKVPDQIKGVKLDRDQYYDYQDHAGIATRLALDNLIKTPGWQNIPEFARANMITRQIAASRKQAEVYMQATYPNLVNEAVDDRMGRILQGKPKPFSFERP